jgi:membrane-bound serine protease (ClpP class)
MNILLDPNVAYLVLVLGFMLAIMALFAPGTGLLEVGGLIALAISGYAIYNIPVNGWALVILLVGVFPFLLATRRSRQWGYLLISILALALGSVFLFRSASGGPAVNPFLAIIVSLTVGVFLWFVVRKSLQAMLLKPVHNPDALLGQVGEARTDISNEGSAYVGGEAWSARSAAPIQKGTSVRVIRREGLILEVEPATSPDAPVS